MNRKGFTLIELLAVIILIALLGALIAPSILTAVNSSKQASYNTLIKNVVTASQTYYEECEYGDLSDQTKYLEYACNISDGKIETTLGALANTGILYVKDDDIDTNKKIVKDPKSNKDISTCRITIKKEVTSKVTYKIENNDSREICPTEYK